MTICNTYVISYVTDINCESTQIMIICWSTQVVMVLAFESQGIGFDSNELPPWHGVQMGTWL